MTTARRDRLVVHAVGSGILGLLAWMTMAFGIGPTLAAAAEARERRVEQDRMMAEIQAGEARRGQIEDRIESVRTALQDVALRVRPLSDINRRYADVIELASDCNLLVGESRTFAPRPEQWFVRVPMRIEGRGPVEGVASFFQRVRQELPDVEVVAFEIARIDEPLGTDMTVAIDLAWYAASDDPNDRVGG